MILFGRIHIEFQNMNGFSYSVKTNRSPFDLGSPIAYSIAVAFQLLAVRMAFGHVANLLSFAIGAYLFGMSLIKEWRNMCQSIIKKLKRKPSRANIMPQLSKFIRFSYIKQLGETK